MSGVDKLAQRLLGERGVQTLRSATPEQYRRAVRDVLDHLQNGQLLPVISATARSSATAAESGAHPSWPTFLGASATPGRASAFSRPERLPGAPLQGACARFR